MNGLWVSVLAGGLSGFFGGVLVLFAERFVFTAPEAVHGLKRSVRFYRQLYWKSKGRRITACPRCLHAQPESVVDPAVLPDGWENAPSDVAWLQCPDCKEVWGLQPVITSFRPAPKRESE